MKISNDAFNGLNQIATATKMDCWFLLEEKDGEDIIVDLENDEELDFTDGLSQLSEGIVDSLSSMGLSKEEIEAVRYLFEFYGIPIDETVFC